MSEEPGSSDHRRPSRLMARIVSSPRVTPMAAAADGRPVGAPHTDWPRHAPSSTTNSRNLRMRATNLARDVGPASPANGRFGRRFGILGFPFSRLPSHDSSYSSLDNVTWSTARALRRHG